MVCVKLRSRVQSVPNGHRCGTLYLLRFPQKRLNARNANHPGTVCSVRAVSHCTVRFGSKKAWTQPLSVKDLCLMSMILSTKVGGGELFSFFFRWKNKIGQVFPALAHDCVRVIAISILTSKSPAGTMCIIARHEPRAYGGIWLLLLKFKGHITLFSPIY